MAHRFLQFYAQCSAGNLAQTACQIQAVETTESKFFGNAPARRAMKEPQKEMTRQWRAIQGGFRS